jgi:hypothetical protein
MLVDMMDDISSGGIFSENTEESQKEIHMAKIPCALGTVFGLGTCACAVLFVWVNVYIVAQRGYL